VSGCGPGLPDGIFSNKNPNLGKFSDALYLMDDVDMFYRQFAYSITI
jgi:hypothetical protein